MKVVHPKKLFRFYKISRTPFPPPEIKTNRNRKTKNKMEARPKFQQTAVTSFARNQKGIFRTYNPNRNPKNVAGERNSNFNTKPQPKP